MINRITGVAYAAPMVPVLLIAGLVNVMPGLFAEHYGLALTTISLVVFVAGLFDTITDPFVGYWSDRVQANSGRRRWFVILGCLSLVLCAWCLFVPKTQADGSISVPWFVFWYLIFYWTWTCIMIPHFALGRELSLQSDERTRIFGLRKGASLWGLMLINLIPLLPLFSSTKMTLDTMAFSVGLASVMMVPAVLLFVRYIPAVRGTAETAATTENSFKALRDLATNVPYRLYVGSHLFYGVGVGGFQGLIFILVNSLLGLGEHYIFMTLLHLVVAILLVRPAVTLANRLGKHRLFYYGIGLKIVAYALAMAAIYADITIALVFLYISKMLLAGTSSFCNIAQPALLSDIVDYDTLKTGRQRTGTYFALDNFLTKVGSASLGPALGIGLVGLFGFDPSAPQKTEDIQFAFSVAMGWIPILSSAIAGWLFFLIPLNGRRCAIIRKRLKQREDRALIHVRNGAAI